MDTNGKAYVPDHVPLWPTVKWMGILMLFVLLSILFARVIYPSSSIRLWSMYKGGTTAPFSARQAPANDRPRLQVDETADLETYQAQQRALLQEYAWVDKGAGVVRIPIEQAMKRLLERGVPTRKGAAP